MARFLSKREKKLWTAPGTAVFVGEVHMEEPQVEVISYDESKIEDQTVGIDGWSAHKPIQLKSQWVNVTGIHRIEPIKDYLDQLGMHILTQEDVFNTTQRPKFEEHRDYLFVVLRMI